MKFAFIVLFLICFFVTIKSQESKQYMQAQEDIIETSLEEKYTIRDSFKEKGNSLKYLKINHSPL